jgi:hypothetical protein
VVVAAAADPPAATVTGALAGGPAVHPGYGDEGLVRRSVVNQVDAPGRAGEARTSGEGGYRFAVAAYLVVAIVLVLTVALSEHLLERWAGYPIARLHFPGSWLFEGWVRYDGNWYRDIVSNGYRYNGAGSQANVAYFPGYPMVLWALTQVVGDTAVAGIALTFASGLASIVLFQRWCRTRLDPRTMRLAVIVMLVYPFAWYLFGTVYADALFLAFALGAFLLLEAGHPILAGLVGALATFTRPVGVAVVIGLVLVTIERKGGFGKLRTLQWRDAGVLLSALGLAAWSAYQGIRWGNPLLFTDIEGAPGWDQASGPRTWFKITFLQRMHRLPGWLGDSISHTTVHSPRPWTESVYSLSILLQALILVGAVVLVRVVWRRIGWGYAGYVLGIIAVAAIGTKDFFSVGRYLLGAFPLFAALALVLIDRPRTRVAAVATSAVLLLLLTSGYARGYYLA